SSDMASRGQGRRVFWQAASRIAVDYLAPGLVYRIFQKSRLASGCAVRELSLSLELLQVRSVWPAHTESLASISFGAPPLLFGVAAIVLPVLIHLLLRPRPRRVRFPALQRVASVLVAGRKAHRVRQWGLLAVRAAALACAAMLLAAPRCDTGAGPGGPVARVIVIDDSASMGYANATGESRRELAEHAALRIASSTRDEPDGSELGLIRTASSEADVPLTAELVRVEAALRRVTTAGAASIERSAPLGRSLRSAAEMLRNAKPARREIVVISDQLAGAWRDVGASSVSGVRDVSLRLVSPDAEALSNLAIVNARAAPPVFADSPVRVDVGVQATGAAGTFHVELYDATGRLIGVTEPDSIANETGEARVEASAGEMGWHVARVVVAPEDRLTFDQARWLTYYVEPRPVAWRLDAGQPEDALTLRILSTLLAPTGLSADRQRVELRRYSPTSIPVATGAGAEPALIVTTLTDAGADWATRLRNAVERGATLLIVPGGAAGDWPAVRGLVTTTPPRVDSLDGPIRMRWAAEAPLGGARGIDEFTRVDVTQRLGSLRPVDGARVVAVFDDGAPAWIERRVGQGRVILLATAPDPTWSALGSRAAGLLTLMHRIVEQERAVAPMFDLGEIRRDALAPGVSGRVTVRNMAVEGKGVEILVDSGAPASNWPTREPGVYAIESAGTEIGRYVVNWPEEESAPELVSAADLSERLGIPVTMEDLNGALGETKWSWTPDVFVIVALALLGLMSVEAWLSARRGPAPKTETRA
ncbi:MAG: VWA domain-containing protein, partial [Phycisphaerales bacterium]|nr:VWA domain-containing protein [Phycisphaerales bacterium]